MSDHGSEPTDPGDPGSEPTDPGDGLGPAAAGEGGGQRLLTYRAKRSFQHTPEPEGSDTANAGGDGPGGGGTGGLRFVVQKHNARRLHYDVRLEVDGVLASWAVPKGPSLDPAVKRLAVHVEDHPLEYRHFEGIIPGAEYGAGSVIVWDEGTYRNLTERGGREVNPAEAVAAGHLSVWLDGVKLHGGWSLTRTGDDKSWILVKRRDEHATGGTDVTEAQPASVRTGRTLAQVEAEAAPAAAGGGGGPSRRPAAWRTPMLAATGTPRDVTGPPGTWRVERKLDGLRCVAVRNGPAVTLWSRNRLPFTDRFPDVVAALGRLPADDFTLDGELVTWSGQRTSFLDLQRPGGSDGAVLCAFDLLHLLGQDTTALPLEARAELLAQLLAGVGPSGDAVRAVVPLEGEPVALLERACQEGWEGVVAKRAGSPYRPGRSADWRKLKCTASQELVVVGWTDPSGSRTGFGALLLGYYEDGGRLRYAGKVGTGFDHLTLASLSGRLADLTVTGPSVADPPRLRGAHWVRPELVAAVAFTEWTTDGRLRHPSFQGLRDDKPAGDVRREDRGNVADAPTGDSSPTAVRRPPRS